jgi:hypothetical protein
MENLSQPIEMEDDDMGQCYKNLAMSFIVEENKLYVRTLILNEDVHNLKVRASTIVGALTDDIATLHNVITHLKARYKQFGVFNRYSHFDITREIATLTKVEYVMRYINSGFDEIDEGCETLIEDTNEHLTMMYTDLLEAYTKNTYPSNHVGPDTNHVLNEIIRLESINPTFTEFEFEPGVIDCTDTFINLFPEQMSIKQKEHLYVLCKCNALSSSAKYIFKNMLDSDYVNIIDDCINMLKSTIKLLRNIINKLWYKHSIFKDTNKETKFEIRTEMQILKSILGKLHLVSKDVIGLNTDLNMTRDDAINNYDVIVRNYLNYYLKTIDQHIDVEYDSDS